MIALFLLFCSIGLLPLLIGLIRARPSWAARQDFPLAECVLLCALAFNLTFFWQELWLVLPKALVPDLHPILFHNDHQWTGTAGIAELLQGTGAIATLVSGILFTILLASTCGNSGTWQLFCFWMAFQGLFQSLTQLAVGTMVAGNDVGRALSYLGVGPSGRGALLLLSVGAMLVAGIVLARLFPIQPATGRAAALPLSAVALLSVMLITPFRLPRDPVEVILIPTIVDIIGTGWLAIGLTLRPPGGTTRILQRPSLVGPACALLILLIVFQFVLRPGVRF